MQTRMDSTAAAWQLRWFRRWPSLAALAAAAVLLGACGLPAILDLPAYDPQRGSASDGFLYPDADMVIESVDGRKVSIGHKYWSQLESGSEFLYAKGPAPSERLDGWRYFTFSGFSYDSALLSAGPHEISVIAVDQEYVGDDKFQMQRKSVPIELSFDVEPRAYYRLTMLNVAGSDGKKFWAVVLKGTCPLKDRDWIWPLEWDCFKNGLIVGSVNRAHIGRRYSEVFKAE